MCDCINELNKRVADKNMRVKRVFGMRDVLPNILIEMEKLDKSKRQKPVSIIAAYCPFCGEKYENA